MNLRAWEDGTERQAFYAGDLIGESGISCSRSGLGVFISFSLDLLWD